MSLFKGATCNVGSNGLSFTCSCANRYSGTYCTEAPVYNFCNSTNSNFVTGVGVCQNGGTCRNTPATYGGYCDCTASYTGVLCQTGPTCTTAQITNCLALNGIVNE